jgi:TfoX/Sxy family transcriptional regulator of competence genes
MPTDPQEIFDRITDGLLGDSQVERGRMFGSVGLKFGGKVFAMLVKDHLVVKLSTAQARELVDTGVGRFFDPGHGRLMKQWISVPVGRSQQWHSLADRAREYAATS